MSLALNSFLNGKVQEPTTQVVEEVEQSQTEIPKEEVTTVSEVAYKELQSFATVNRQELIETRVELAMVKPQSLLEIKDKKLQDKVVERLYPSFKNVEELQLVHGKEFWKTEQVTETIGEDIPTPSTSIEKELKLIKYQLAKKELNDAISEFKRSNPSIVINEDKEEKLREEVSNISADLSPSERVARA